MNLIVVGVWPCDEWVLPDMPGMPPWGIMCCVCAVVAASKSGLTCEPPWGPSWGCGVFAPVPIGVETLDGISDVKIVAEEGETRYLVWIVWSRDSLKPM